MPHRTVVYACRFDCHRPNQAHRLICKRKGGTQGKDAIRCDAHDVLVYF